MPHRWADWTDGCLHVPDGKCGIHGTVVQILARRTRKPDGEGRLVHKGCRRCDEINAADASD
jgi:hypothetical protein